MSQHEHHDVALRTFDGFQAGTTAHHGATDLICGLALPTAGRTHR